MPDINPISNQEDILKEANSNITQAVVVPPSVQISDPSVAVLMDTPKIIDSPSQLNPQPISAAPLIATPPIAINRIVEVQDTSNFNYRLPVFSYVLVWFYVIAAVVIGGFLAYYLNIISKYSSSSYSSSSSVSSAYNSIIYPLALVVAGCVAILVSLFKGTQIYRYVAIGVSIVLVGFEAYGVYRLATSMSGYYSFGETISTYFSYYSVFLLPLLQYILLPVVTLAYLFTPKAIRAYN